jgi:hypothetical protein
MTRFGQTKLYPSVISAFSKTIEESKIFIHTRQQVQVILFVEFIADFRFILFLFLFTVLLLFILSDFLKKL